MSEKKYDYFKNEYNYNDLDALLKFVKQIKDLFVFYRNDDNGRDLYKISYSLPATLAFENDTDLFRKMTDLQMTNFKEKIDNLYDDLEDVKEEVDVVEQCEKLKKIFGEEFPVPKKESASKQQLNYIPSSSASGSI